METTVDVQDLAGDPARQVREQQQDRPRHRAGILAVPAERRLPAPRIGQFLEPRNPVRGQSAERTGRDQVDSYPAVSEITQIIEDEYGVQLKAEDRKSIRTIGDAIDAVVRQAG